MRLRTILMPVVGVAAAIALAAPAQAGEVTGNGKPTPNDVFGHSASICSFSGLQDGDDDGDNVPDPGVPNGPGTAPQNWGHTKQELRALGLPAAEIAAERPGVTCNGHTGIVAGSGVR
jgi:hypothetical protein